MANNIIKRVWNQNRMVTIEDLKGMAFQAESGGHTFQISGVDDAGNTVELSGTVAGVFLRPDNTDVAITGSASGGVVSVTLPANCYDIPGRFGLTVFVTSNGQKTAIYAAIGTVNRTSSGEVSPQTATDVVDLINAINAAVATIPASWTGLMADIAPEYSTSALYPVGSYVYYNGDLYRCTTAITTAESWTAAHWTTAVLGQDVSDLKSAIDDKINAYSNIEFSLANKRYNPNGTLATANGMHSTDYYACNPGDRVVFNGKSFIYQGVASSSLIVFFDINKTFISSITKIGDETASTVGTVEAIAPDGTAYVAGTTNSSIIDTDYFHVFDITIETIKSEANAAYNNLQISNQLIVAPILSNGSGGNPNNANAVTARAIPFIGSEQFVAFKCARPISATGNYYRFDVSAFKGSSWYTNRLTGVTPDEHGEIIIDPNRIIYGSAGVDGFGVTIWEYDSNGDLQTLRIGDFLGDDIIVRYIYPDAIQTKREIENDEIEHKVLNARHAPGNSGQRLTLLHFSDLHANTGALSRIVADADRLADLIDDKICTGDIVGNEYAEITSWWDKSILTCIGNHDTASYSGGVYDWTALNMANRDAYYIAPFENNWGITHTPGTSYYYKDYTTPKVRMIVLDAMLYTGTPGEEATTQTEWLANLLSDAITNNLHVLIAIHSPHGGATAKDCSFSKYEQSTMPTYNDCNTPQVVIDAVATAISSGLHFIGYIVGHTHQDNIWDAENDGTQLMYCVTCATTAAIQWRNSDQDRSNNVDAYNLITIDTANTLVKIVRGGGADIDDHMRTRKAICFNYSTGHIVGEVL